MTIVKVKKPSAEGQIENPVAFHSPFAGLFENLFGENYFTKEFASSLPAVNFSETNGKYLLEISAPGFEKNDFKIENQNGSLIVNGNHKAEIETKEKTFFRKEFMQGSFERIFSLANEVNEENIEAHYVNGILKISLEKKQNIMPTSREIKIS